MEAGARERMAKEGKGNENQPERGREMGMKRGEQSLGMVELGVTEQEMTELKMTV